MVFMQAEFQKNFDGNIVAWYSNIARAKNCDDQKFSKILSSLGYSCESLEDIDGIHTKPKININPDAHPEFDQEWFINQLIPFKYY